MYVNRPGYTMEDAKKKIEIIDTITFDEYIAAFLNMLTDVSPPYPITGSINQNINHLAQIANDNLIREWQHVRKWSTYHFDQIEKGIYNWEDTTLIKIDRSYIQQASVEASNQIEKEKKIKEKSEKRVEICRAWNRNQCDGPDHYMGSLYLQHFCSYCFKRFRLKHRHSEHNCEIKKEQAFKFQGYQQQHQENFHLKRQWNPPQN